MYNSGSKQSSEHTTALVDTLNRFTNDVRNVRKESRDFKMRDTYQPIPQNPIDPININRYMHRISQQSVIPLPQPRNNLFGESNENVAKRRPMSFILET